MIKTVITDMSCEDANGFFLREKNYCSLDLPKYFDFQLLLDKINERYTSAGYRVIKQNSHFWLDIPEIKGSKDWPSNHNDVSCHLVVNKDGHYDWRSLQILNPILYVIIVNEITQKDNWKQITDRFRIFQLNSRIKCMSLPFSKSDGGSSDKGETITNWWSETEQQSLELSMRYKYMLSTDITNCYGSIYTHAISWALHGKQYAKEKRNDDIIGNRIDAIIRWFTYGETCGIPQGSVLMDFIAEMVLGYIDYELTKKIYENLHEDIDYTILRYRDDYKIFANTKEDVAKIAKLLTTELEDVNFRLNPSKTCITDHIIQGALKPDKFYWMEAKTELPNLQKHLLLIHSLSEKHPNSGSLITALKKFFDRITPETFVKDNSSSNVLSAIMIDIIYHNPKVYPVAIPILGRILDLQGCQILRKDVLKRLNDKISTVPYTQFADLWLQRLTIKQDRSTEYSAPLCKVAYDNQVKIWNNEWASGDLKTIVDSTSIINDDVIKKMNESPDSKEIEIFMDKYNL